ncbi:unnamed protein product [Caenorhabditis brenneri]
MVRTMQTACTSIGGKAPRIDTEKVQRQRQLALRKQRAEEKAQKAMEIAARYTTAARDDRAGRRAEEALKRETEEAAKKNE